MNLTDWEGDEIVRRNLVQEEGQVGCERAFLLRYKVHGKCERMKKVFQRLGFY